MSYENFPESENPAEPVAPAPKKGNGRNIIVGVLIVALLGTWGYIIYDNNAKQQEKTVLTSQLTTSDSAKNELQHELDDAALRLDALKTSNARADSLIQTKDADVSSLKTRIQNILNDKKATQAQLDEARRLIAQLKGNIDTYASEIEALKTQNAQLTQQNAVISSQRDSAQQGLQNANQEIKQKQEVIDVGSTLHASNFDIVGIKKKGSGKEKETSKAKKVDMLKISFVLDENRITQSGPQEIYISITSPDGKSVTVDALGSGTFKTRDGVEHPFTKKVTVNYVQGQKQPVTVEWSQNSKFQTGNYKVEVYNNGFKIGEGTVTFKKGGLF